MFTFRCSTAAVRTMVRPAFGVLLLGLAAACGAGSADSGGDSVAAAPSGAGMAASGSGEQLYQRCATCHQPNGQGLQGVYPPLVGSEYATAANVAVPIRIVLHGMQGPITVKGTQYSGVMPQYGIGIQMTDQEVAQVLTYVRQSWGNSASAVTPEQVAAERAANRSATGPVTAEELRGLM